MWGLMFEPNAIGFWSEDDGRFAIKLGVGSG